MVLVVPCIIKLHEFCECSLLGRGCTHNPTMFMTNFLYGCWIHEICTYPFVCVCMCACTCVRVCVYMYVCMYVFMYVCIYVGTAVAKWLRRCVTNRKVAGSIPAGVKRIFH